MQGSIAARFATEAEAERALSAIASQVPLTDSAVLGAGPTASFTLDSLSLSPQERSDCEQQLKRGGFLLVAQTADEGATHAVVRVLGSIPEKSEWKILSAPAAEAEPSAVKPPAAEERIPLVEEEIRIGKREVVRGGARVHSYTAEVPVTEDVELFFERADVTSRPVNRRVTDDEVVQGGLLQERVIEVTEMREEAIVSKESFVREELVVTKQVEHRTEQIHETVRRTEVETETIFADGRTSSGSFRAGDREPVGATAGEDRQ
jgi:stress response protein YsnF